MCCLKDAKASTIWCFEPTGGAAPTTTAACAYAAATDRGAADPQEQGRIVGCFFRIGQYSIGIVENVFLPVAT